jgi:hypothetical protein
MICSSSSDAPCLCATLPRTSSPVRHGVLSLLGLLAGSSTETGWCDVPSPEKLRAFCAKEKCP